MLAIWGVLAVFPFFLSPPTNFSWKTFTDTSPSYMIQGYGLDDTFLVYGQHICSPSNLRLPAVCVKQDNASQCNSMLHAL